MPEVQKRVLVVDDDVGQRDAIAAMIERWGFTIAVAGDGAEALERMRTFEPDTIVTDLLMAGMAATMIVMLTRG